MVVSRAMRCLKRNKRKLLIVTVAAAGDRAIFGEERMGQKWKLDSPFSLFAAQGRTWEVVTL